MQWQGGGENATTGAATSASSNGAPAGVNGMMEQPSQPNSTTEARPGGPANQQLSHLLQNKNPVTMGMQPQQTQVQQQQQQQPPNQHTMMSQQNLMVNSLNNTNKGASHPAVSMQGQPQGLMSKMGNGPINPSSVPHSMNDTMGGTMNNMQNIPGGGPMVTSMASGTMTSTSMTGGHLPMSSSGPPMSNTMTSLSGGMTGQVNMVPMNKNIVTSMAPNNISGGQMTDGVMTNGPMQGMPPQGMVQGIRGPTPQSHVGGPMGPRHPVIPNSMPQRMQVRF